MAKWPRLRAFPPDIPESRRLAESLASLESPLRTVNYHDRSPLESQSRLLAGRRWPRATAHIRSTHALITLLKRFSGTAACSKEPTLLPSRSLLLPRVRFAPRVVLLHRLRCAHNSVGRRRRRRRRPRGGGGGGPPTPACCCPYTHYFVRRSHRGRSLLASERVHTTFGPGPCFARRI